MACEAPSAPPLVAVVTPTKNRLRLLGETLDSVGAQSFTAWEHIVVDDGSDDGTAEMVAARAAEDPRVRYLVRDKGLPGANACRNLGLCKSRAQFILFLDSDDVLDSGCLEERVRILRRNDDLDFVTFQAGIFVRVPGDMGRVMDTEMLGDDLTRFLYFEAPWQTSAPIWRKDSLLRLGGFDESLASWQDIELHVRAIAAGLRYVRFPQIDHHIRWQFEEAKISVEQRRSPHHLKGAIDIVEILERHVRTGPGMNWVRQRALCSLYFFVAERWIEIGRLAEAQRAWATICRRRLGSRLLHVSGAILLAAMAMGLPIRRVVGKWKGWVRLRTQMEILKL